MGFDEPADTDKRVRTEGVEVVMDPSFDKYLEQCILDFVEMDDGSWQFVFLNPADPITCRQNSTDPRSSRFRILSIPVSPWNCR